MRPILGHHEFNDSNTLFQCIRERTDFIFCKDTIKMCTAKVALNFELPRITVKLSNLNDSICSNVIKSAALLKREIMAGQPNMLRKRSELREFVTR